MNKHPAFFNFFTDESSNTKLKIPPSFTQKIEGALPERVYLMRFQSDNSWKIKVRKIENDWYFSNGWDKFVTDNAIKSGDILVFQYFYRNAFNVKVYGPNAIQKDPVGEYVHERAEEEEEDGVQVPEEDDEEKEAETENEDKNPVSENEEQVNTDGVDTTRNKPKRLRVRSTSADWYGRDIFRAGLAQQPINPYFVTTTRARRKTDLYIPREIARDCNLELTQELLLVDPQGREFPAKWKKWKDGRIVVSGGAWRRLCTRNLVDREDKCICEFVPPRDDGRLLISVSFVRANAHLRT